MKKVTKKSLSILAAAVLMLVCVLPSFLVSAEQAYRALPSQPMLDSEPPEGSVVFDVRNTEFEDGLYYALPGETVAVEFKITGEYEAHGANIWFDYDPEMLTIDHIDKGPVLTENAVDIGALVLLDWTTIPGSIRLGITAAVDPLTQEGVIYTVYFVVDEVVPMDTLIPLTPNIQEFVNMPVGEEASDIPFFVYDGNINVHEPPIIINPGDYDCDDDVDITDALLTLRASMELITPSEQSLLNADIDEDGALSVTDALAILRMSMGLA